MVAVTTRAAAPPVNDPSQTDRPQPSAANDPKLGNTQPPNAQTPGSTAGGPGAAPTTPNSPLAPTSPTTGQLLAGQQTALTAAINPLTPIEQLRLSPTTTQALLSNTSPGDQLVAAAGSPPVDSSTPLLTAQAVPSASPTRVVGENIGGRARQDAQAQLRLEAQLNGGAYGTQLSRAADNIPNSAQLNDGSYRAAQNSRDRLRTDIGNALEIANYSGTPQQAVARIQQYDQQIRAKEADAARWLAAAPALGATALRNAAQARAEAAQLGFDRGEFINNVRLQSGKSENGNMYQALANGADPNRTPVIFVNGINTDFNRSRLQALELSAQFNSPVNHIVNVSSKDKLVRAGTGVAVGGALSEGQTTEQFDQRVQQHLAGNRPAAIATANAILDQLYDPTLRASKAPVKVVGYSQGASITSQALRDVDSHLSREVAAGRLSQGEKEQMLGRIRFLGVGPAAADRHITQDYREGGAIVQRNDLRHVNYRIIADRNDQIANLVGVGDAQPNVQRALQAGARLAQNDFHAHLSYFRSYEAMDPGSIYNGRQIDPLFESWFNGSSVRGLTTTDGPPPANTR
jgi:hypothetical protein